MVRIFLLITLMISFISKAQIKQNLEIPKNPKIGLSLAGGGAKGFSHIGVLKVIDSLGIKIDYIAGTSMGAIVGGLYASGYTAKDIETIVMETDFYNLIANEKTRKETTFFSKSNDKYLLTVPIKNGKAMVIPKAISTGQKNVFMLKDLFRNVSNIEDFSQLPIPFMCIGTNLESGEMKIFEKGDLVSSIMASSAFPGLMDPVKIGDSVYIDGAMTINYPSKPLKDKGIDIVIGVDLNQPLAKREDINSIVDILNQLIDFNIHKETQNQYQYTDINIKPNLDGVSSISYDDKKKILQNGEIEAQKYISTLNQLPKRNYTLLRAPLNPIYTNVYKIDSLNLENGNIFNQNYAQGKMGLKIPSMQTYGNINKMIDKLYATNNYNLITYDILQSDNQNILNIKVEEDDTKFFLKFGLHYDEIMKTGLLTNITIKRLLLRNSTLSADFIFGDKPRYYINYLMDNGYIPGLGFYSSGMQINRLSNSTQTYAKANWFRNELFIQSIWRDRYAIGGGFSSDYIKLKDLINNGVETPTKASFFNPFIFIKSDTQDDKSFPSRGIFINTEGKLITSLSPEEKEDTPAETIQAKGDIRLNFPVSKNFTYRIRLFGGFSIGKDAPPLYKYSIGGIFEQNFNNIISVPGYDFSELSSDNLLLTSHDFQYQIRKNFFAIANINISNLFDEITLKNAVRISHYSAGITLGYKSPFGQIKLNYSRSLNKNTSDNKGYFSTILGHWF